jgi:N-acetyl-gamma-glutamyl-phosphate reductase
MLHDYAYCMHKVPVGVLGASGYAGRELCDLIIGHPMLDLAWATANDQCGTTVRVRGRDVTFISTDDVPLQAAELVFSALPHGTSQQWVARARASSALVVDLSADLRPGNGPAGIPYGLTELNRSAVSCAPLVANPGCYATSILTAMAPLFCEGLVADDATIVVNAASGVTGAGNNPKRELLFAEVATDYRAYALGNVHRHLKEMRATLEAWGSTADLVFTPHLLPVARGILSTITVPIERPLTDPLAPWRNAYSNEAFIELCADGPALRDVLHRNVVRISAASVVGTRRPMLLVTSAIDNLMKGAAGQAVQNANLMLSLDETLGLAA